eukprot:COSAG06_NODE_22000_length_737_cov_31.600313_1_plen_118_part_00
MHHAYITDQVVTECYNYSGCSFLPALPWPAVDMPLGLPSLSVIMLAGFFEQAVTAGNSDDTAGQQQQQQQQQPGGGGVDGDSQSFLYWTFVIALAAVPVGFLMHLLTRYVLHTCIDR